MKGPLPRQRHGFIPLHPSTADATRFSIDPAEACRRHKSLEAAHRVSPLLDASMILLQVIIQMAIGTMDDSFPQRSFNGPRVPAMAVSRDPSRNTVCDRTGG